MCIAPIPAISPAGSVSIELAAQASGWR